MGYDITCDSVVYCTVLTTKTCTLASHRQEARRVAHFEERKCLHVCRDEQAETEAARYTVVVDHIFTRNCAYIGGLYVEPYKLGRLH